MMYGNENPRFLNSLIKDGIPYPVAPVKRIELRACSSIYFIICFDDLNVAAS